MSPEPRPFSLISVGSMSELRDLSLEQPFPRELREVLSPPASGVSESSTGTAKVFPGLPLHKRPFKVSIELVIVLFTLVTVFLVFQCAFWGRAAVSSSTGRRLADGGNNRDQQYEVSDSVCRGTAEALGKQRKEGGFVGASLPPAADPAATETEPGSSGSLTEKRKSDEHSYTEASRTKMARKAEWEASALELFEGLLREQVAMEIPSTSHTLSSEAIEGQYSTGAATGPSGQQQEVELLFQSATQLHESSQMYFELPEILGGNFLPVPSPAYWGKPNQLQWGVPSTSGIATGGAAEQSLGIVSRESPSHAPAAPSTSSLSARAGGSSEHVSSAAELDFAMHPFYRLPKKPQLPEFEGSNVHVTAPPPSLVALPGLMNSIRGILVKEELSDEDVISLITKTRILQRYVDIKIKGPVGSPVGAKTLDKLACRFLVADALWSVYELLGEGLLMVDSLSMRETMSALASVSGNCRLQIELGRYVPKMSRRLLRGLVAALDQYGAGRRPAPWLVFALKYEIFFQVDSEMFHSCKNWDSWRRDHRLSVKSTDSNKNPLPSAYLQAFSNEVIRRSAPSASHSSESVGALTAQAPTKDCKHYYHHPDYRLPSAQSVEGISFIDREKRHKLGFRASAGSILASVRELLLRSSLTKEEAESLVTGAERLIHFAFAKMKYKRPLERRRGAARYFAIRFWVLDALWSTCEVLGRKASDVYWWASLVDLFSPIETRTSTKAQTTAPQGVASTKKAKTPKKGVAWSFVERCAKALEEYKAGRRPSACEVVELKQTILSRGYIKWKVGGPAAEPKESSGETSGESS